MKWLLIGFIGFWVLLHIADAVLDGDIKLPKLPWRK